MPSSSQDLPDRRGHVLVLARQAVRMLLQHRHPAAEAPEHLRELETNEPAAYHDEVAGHLAQLHDRLVVERVNAVQPGDRRHARPGPGVDEDVPGGQHPCVAAMSLDGDFHRPAEPGVAHHELERLVPFHPLPASRAPRLDDVALALADDRQVHLDGTGPHAVVGGTAGQVRHAGAGHHGLGRRAARNDAGAADPLGFFDDRRLPAGLGERARQRLPALPRADDDCVELFRHQCSPSITSRQDPAPPSPPGCARRAWCREGWARSRTCPRRWEPAPGSRRPAASGV